MINFISKILLTLIFIHLPQEINPTNNLKIEPREIGIPDIFTCNKSINANQVGEWLNKEGKLYNFIDRCKIYKQEKYMKKLEEYYKNYSISIFIIYLENGPELTNIFLEDINKALNISGLEKSKLILIGFHQTNGLSGIYCS